MNRSRNGIVIGLMMLIGLVSGCGRDMSDLEAYIAEVNARPGGRIEPLPVIRPYESFTYDPAPCIPDEFVPHGILFGIPDR